MSEWVYRAYEPGDEAAVVRSIVLAFANPEDRSKRWISEAGPERFRVLVDEEGALGATALLQPMGIYFGGRSVGMQAVAGITVPPERRGAGAARRVMESALREAHREGQPLSVLYASTQELYRRLGYEQAGHWCRAVVDPARIDAAWPAGSSLRVRAMADSDEPAVEACYARFASAHDGCLDRSEYIWHRVRGRGERVVHGWVVEDASGVVLGYVYLEQRADAGRPDGRHEIVCHDLVATSGSSARAMWSFLKGFRSMAHTVSFHGSPAHAMLAVLDDRRFEMTTREWWMLRVVDAPAAIAARGYAPGLSARVELELEDEVLPSNAGRWTLTVEGGTGRLEEGGGGGVAIKMDARALAMLYSGFRSATQSALVGHVAGEPGALRLLDAVFAGPAPSMADMF